MIRRREPVLWGNTPLENPEWEAICQDYARKGYAVIEDAIGTQALSNLKTLLEESVTRPGVDSDGTIVLEHDSKTVRSVFAIHESVHAVMATLHDTIVPPLVARILGGAAYVHQSRVNFKGPFDGEKFAWHSDFETWQQEDGMSAMRAVSCMVMLDNNFHCNGPLMVIPGSHYQYVGCPCSTPQDNHLTSLRRQVVGVPDEHAIRILAEMNGGIECLVAPAGSVILFDCNLLHASNENMSPYPRANIFLVFNSVENLLEQPAGGTLPRPEYIAHRERLTFLKG